MIDSTGRHGPRSTSHALRISGIVLLLLLGSACGRESTGGDPRISAEAERSSAGALESLKIEGRNFTPNGTVLLTFLMRGPAENSSPYVEEQVQADGDGKITVERRPVPCPQPAVTASLTLVTARDMTSGISGSDQVRPGGAPDCTG